MGVMFAPRLARFRIATAAIAGLGFLAGPSKLWGIAWNATDPNSSAISSGGLTDNYGEFINESVVTNTQQGEFGTGTYLGNGWLLTALHVVSGSTYGVLVPGSSIQVNVFGTNYTLDNYQTFGSSDIVLCHLAGYTSGPAANLPGVERSQIYTGSSETGNLEQLGGFGVNGQLNSGTDVNNETFHRGFNIAFADGGSIDVSADGNPRLVEDGYVLGYQQAGDSGSGLWMDNGPDQDLDLHDWSLIGALDTGNTPGFFGDGGQYARVSSYAGTIISTVFPHAWLTWTANASSGAVVDGSGVWNLSSTNFTDGTNFAFNGPERTQIATFGAGSGAAGIVTLGANINIDSLTFNAAGAGNYTIAGGGFSLHLTQGSTIATNVDATISANMIGGSSTQFGAVNEVVKNGAGTLTLTGQTTLDSDVTFHARAGTTVIDGGGSFSAPWYTSIGVYTGDAATLTLGNAGSFSTGSDFNLGDLGGTGTLNVENSASLTATTMYIGKGIGGLTGAGGTGTVNQTGGTVTAPFISLATNHPASVGIYNLNGGNLFTTSITGGLGTSTFNFNGGQIIATANSTTLMQNLTSATINGAAIINTNGFNVTVAQPLLHSGVGPMSDGGLTKLGGGTLTLGGASTYTGPTVINGGTIMLNAVAGASAVAIQPVASYSFDNVSGSTVINGGSGGSAMNGTLTGDAQIVSGGKFGNALKLSGNGSVVVNSPITDTGGAANWTVSAWVETTTPGGSIMDKSDGGWTWDNSVFYLGGGNGPGSGGTPSAVRFGRGFFQAGSSTPSVDDGNWHLVTYVDAAGDYSIYTDGNPVALSGGNAGFMQAVEQGGTVSFGITTDSFAGDGTVNFNGMLDEIQIYNRALTPLQIQGLYTSNSANPATASSVLPAFTPVTLASGAALDINGMSQIIGSLSGVAGAAVKLGSGQLTVSSSINSSFAGNISGAGGSLIKSGNGTLALSGVDTYSGGTDVMGGVLKILPTGPTTTALANGALTISGSGEVQLAANVTLGSQLGSTPASNVNIVLPSITGNGSLDITNNHIIIDYAAGDDPILTVRGYLLSGYAGGEWNGPGIDSSSVDGNPGYGIGYADATDPGNPAGLAAGQIEIKYTLYGDANLDGLVTGNDFTILVGNLNKSVNSWDQGDFNYDGAVSGVDFTMLIGNLGKAANGADIAVPAADFAAIDAFAAANGLMADVPEPGSGMVLVIVAARAMGRRRRSL